MEFSKMTAKQKAEKTYMDLQRRRKEREKGVLEANGFVVSSIERIRHKQYHSRINKFSTY